MAAAVESKMDKNRVIKLLEFFPEIDGEIKACKSMIADLEQWYNPVSGIQYDGMPKGKNHIGRQTEEAALKIPDFVREEIDQNRRKIDSLQKIKVEILKGVSRLKLQQKTVVFGFYFHGMKWEQVAEHTHYSDRQCKNIRDAAVERLSREFGGNATLTQCEIKE